MQRLAPQKRVRYNPPMADFQELDFVIPAYSPETMPLDRLLEYLAHLSQVIGDPENLHLVAIGKSSTVPKLRMPIATAVQARERARQVQRGEGTQKQRQSYNRIRRMLRRDTGQAWAGRPAVLTLDNTVVLEVPPAPEDLGVVTGVRQQTSIAGSLIKVGGAGEDAALQLQDFSGAILSGFVAKRHLAKELARFIYEPVRLSGIGIWERSADGVWDLDRMQVQSYELLEDDSLEETVAKLRALKIDWPDGAIDLMLQEREGGA